MVRCWVIATRRQPWRGSQVRNRLRVPGPQVLVVLPSGPAPHPLTEERTFQHRFDITRPEPKEKPRKVRKPQPRKPRVRKPRVPTKTVEERIESRRAYEQTRSQTPDRKEYVRLQKQKDRRERKAAGQCRICSSTAIPGQTRCEVCRDKHRVSRRASATKQREKARNAASTEAPGDQ